MKKLFQNKSVVTIISLTFCLVILFFAYRYRVNNAIRATSVPIAARKIESRSKITQNDYKLVKVAASMITKNVITDPKKIENMYVNYNTFIPEGSMFYENAVVDWKSMPDSTWSEINNENTIVSIAVNAKTTFGNSIYPGDTIDLYYQNRDSSGNLFIGKLIEGIKVLAVKDSNGEHIFKKSSQQTDAAALIFSVPEDLHLLLRKAGYLSGGEIIPVPRNASYSEEEEHAAVASEYIRNFINDRAWNLVSDYEQSKSTAVDNTTGSSTSETIITE